MFTGLITDVGTIDRVQTTDAGREFRIRTSFPDLTAGESIAVSGACLTVRVAGIIMTPQTCGVSNHERK